MAAYNTSNQSDTTEQTVQEPDYSGVQSVNFELRKLFEARKNKLSFIKKSIFKCYVSTYTIGYGYN